VNIKLSNHAFANHWNFSNLSIGADLFIRTMKGDMNLNLSELTVSYILGGNILGDP
jgi:hypothetical protein